MRNSKLDMATGIKHEKYTHLHVYLQPSSKTSADKKIWEQFLRHRRSATQASSESFSHASRYSLNRLLFPSSSFSSTPRPGKLVTRHAAIALHLFLQDIATTSALNCPLCEQTLWASMHASHLLLSFSPMI